MTVNNNLYRIPSIDELKLLRKDGMQVGYKGIYIYLRYQAVLETLSASPSKNILNVGCGYGIFDRLLPDSISFTGVDIEPKEIEFARKWAETHRPSYKYICGDLLKLSMPEKSFDLIILSEVIEHIPEEQLPALFAEIEKLLTPQGELLLSVPNRKTARNRARRLIGLPPVIMDRTHLREYSLSEIRSLISGLPYDIIKFNPAVLYLPFEPQFAKVIAPESQLRRMLIHQIPELASHFIFLLKKVE